MSHCCFHATNPNGRFVYGLVAEYQERKTSTLLKPRLLPATSRSGLAKAAGIKDNSKPGSEYPATRGLTTLFLS